MRAAALSSGEQGVELAVALERVQIVAAADMGRADENLRHGHASVARARSSRSRRCRSRATSISVKATPLRVSSALAAWQ